MQNSINEQAAEWLLRISSEDPKPTDQDYVDFQNWKNSDERHAQAIDCMKDLIGNIENLPKAAAVSTINSVIDKKSNSTLASFVLLAVIFSTCFAVIQKEKIAFSLADLKTDGQHQMTELLVDESKITLATNTAANIEFDNKSRAIELIDGRILVNVAKDQRRPFVVQTKHGAMQALGTRFIVEKRPEQTRLIVLESKVFVRSKDAKSKQDERIIPAGKQIVLKQSSLGNVQAIDIQRHERAWNNRQLFFEAESLPSVLAKLSDHYNQHYSYSSTELEVVEVTAVLPTNDHEAALRLLTDSLPISVNHTGKWLRKFSITKAGK